MMKLSKFETEEVMIYKQAEELIAEQTKLLKIKSHLRDNYDSKIIIKAEAYSPYSHNEFYTAPQSIDIPLDIIFDIIPDRKSVLATISERITEIDNKLEQLHNTLSIINKGGLVI